MQKVKTTAVAGTLALVMLTPTAFANTTSNQRYVETNAGWVSYHSAARLDSPILGRLQLGEKAPLVTKANSYWYEIQWNGKMVYITTNAHYTHVVTGALTSGVSGSTPTATTPPPTASSGNPATTPAAPSSSSPSSSSPSSSSTSVSTPTWQVNADKVIATAKTQLGVPYLWGHQEPGIGFDCSNFTAWSFRTALGIAFSGSSVTQRNSVGTPVSLGNIREGDLLFFKTANNPTGSGHVGIYMGNGMVIQEGGGWKKVTIEPLHGTWLGRNLVFARRVIN
ncbi:C40 family peptidase [Alicyclobacillus curvatus]|nr:C40 family peptidase [Alicyclobacillus curvatus]